MNEPQDVVAALFGTAQRVPTRCALRVGDRAWSYAELAGLVSAAAVRLAAAGARAGDRVLLVAPTSAEFVVAYHGILAAGAIAVTVNPSCTEIELGYFLDDADCVLAVGSPSVAATLRAAAGPRDVPVWILDDRVLDDGGPAVPRVPVDDVAVLLYTSGTTGRPKGAELTHAGIVAAARAVTQALDLRDGERMGTALPLFHVYGQVVVMGSALRCGATLSLMPRYDPGAMLRLAADHRLTLLAGVPTMWTDVLDAPAEVDRDDLVALRTALSGGAPLPETVVRELYDRLGATVLEGYGLSEATGVATMCRPGEERRTGSVGRALPGIEVSIVGADGVPAPPGTVGEVVLRGPVLMRGYWRRPEATAEVLRAGLLLTGDLGTLDPDGHLRIVDRKKDVVIRGGYNVYPREIEEVLHGHPAVQEAAVIGIPDARLGEEVAAVVAARPDHEVCPAALREWLAARLAAYKVPRVYRVVDALPRGTTGKIQKRGIDRSEVAALGVRPPRPATPA
ncbi:long-chain fatty acid--CoA ligase [Pseudonocardia halophobica]|uniref:Long-chain-fatty-acid--CoA ligase n=1 Tax=Pseudonocardia halophobica TaxID=29401 RepID=A0A9W6L3H0_9PSEU|nr:AMP-binding protein [Pseudonocardia halophobica]GLL12262.1 long-chain-fatty-acid--CoA ligase [Pseudonocardia halophobica]